MSSVGWRSAGRVNQVDKKYLLVFMFLRKKMLGIWESEVSRTTLNSWFVTELANRVFQQLYLETWNDHFLYSFFESQFIWPTSDHQKIVKIHAKFSYASWIVNGEINTSKIWVFAACSTYPSTVASHSYLTLEASSPPTKSHSALMPQCSFHGSGLYDSDWTFPITSLYDCLKMFLQFVSTEKLFYERK